VGEFGVLGWEWGGEEEEAEGEEKGGRDEEGEAREG
jgi:hypothetical protein